MFRRRFSKQRQMKRETHWLEGFGSDNNGQMSGSSQTQFLLLTQANLSAVGNDHCTFERFVGDFHIQNLDTTVQAGVDIYIGLAFIGIEVSDDTVPTLDPATAIPTKYGYWLHRRSYRLGSIGAASAGGAQQAPTSTQQCWPWGSHYDIRVKRKIVGGQSIVFVVKALNGGGANTVDMRPNFRSLITTR